MKIKRKYKRGQGERGLRSVERVVEDTSGFPGTGEEIAARNK
jgi:hypothetical protein